MSFGAFASYRCVRGTVASLGIPIATSAALPNAIHPHLGQAGSTRITWGSTGAKCGTRAIAATEDSRLPPGRPARRCHAAYVLVELVMPACLTLE